MGLHCKYMEFIQREDNECSQSQKFSYASLKQKLPSIFETSQISFKAKEKHQSYSFNSSSFVRDQLHRFQAYHRHSKPWSSDHIIYLFTCIVNDHSQLKIHSKFTHEFLKIELSVKRLLGDCVSFDNVKYYALKCLL